MKKISRALFFVISFILVFFFLKHTPSLSTTLGQELEEVEAITGLDIKMEWGGGIYKVILDGTNIVNHNDTGRLIQLSIYDGSEKINNWPWNPVQGGDFQNRGSPVLESRGISYVKTQPLLWKGDNQGNLQLADVYFEQWIKQLKTTVYQVKYRVTNFGEKDRKGLHEVPAVYINYPYKDLIFYEGDNPWTNKPLTRKTKQDLEREGKKAFFFQPSEKWGGLVTGENRGIFIYQVAPALHFYWWPDIHGVQNLYYLSPKIQATFLKDSFREFEFYILVGNVGEARREIYALHEKEQGLALKTGWNQINWPNLSGYTAKTALENIENDCGQGTGIAIARKRKDFWEEYVVDYGGKDFQLNEGREYYLKVSKDCNWKP